MDNQKNLREKLKSKGYKLTRPRRTLLEILEQNLGKPHSVQELFAKLKEKGMNFTTIYRNLEMMAKEGIVSAIYRENGVQSYALCYHHHHHHLICVDCGRTKCIDFCPMNLIDNAQWEGFTPLKHRFEVMGICSQCAAKRE